MADQYKLVKEFAAEKVEIVIMLLVLFVIASFFYPEIRTVAYAAMGLLALYFLLQLFLQSGIVLEVPEYKRAVVFRLGHFHRSAGPGWVLIVPILERAEVIDLRVQTMNLPPQDIITNDQIRTEIDAIVYYQVLDPKKAVLKVKEFEGTVTGYVYAALRDISANLNLNELYGEIDKVNDIVKVRISPLTSEWGIDIVDVAITNIRIPEGIQAAMHMRRQAKEEWNAAQFSARAQKTMIEALADASKKLDQKALMYLYVKEALPKIAEGKSTKIFFPAEFASLAQNLTKAGVKSKQSAAALEALYPIALKKIGKELSEEEAEGEEEKEEEGGEKEEGEEQS